MRTCVIYNTIQKCVYKQSMNFWAQKLGGLHKHNIIRTPHGLHMSNKYKPAQWNTSQNILVGNYNLIKWPWNNNQKWVHPFPKACWESHPLSNKHSTMATVILLYPKWTFDKWLQDKESVQTKIDTVEQQENTHSYIQWTAVIAIRRKDIGNTVSSNSKMVKFVVDILYDYNE